MSEINKVKWIKYLIGVISMSIYLTITSDVLSQQIFRNNDPLFFEYLPNIAFFLYPEFFYTNLYNDNELFTYSPFNIETTTYKIFMGEDKRFSSPLLNNPLNNSSFFGLSNLSLNSCLNFFPWLYSFFPEMNFPINIDISPVPDPVVSEESEIYVVYSALIDAKYTRSKILIYDHTYAPFMDAHDWLKEPCLEGINSLGNRLEGLDQEVIQNYINKNYMDGNDQGYPLLNLFTIEREYELVERQYDKWQVHVLEISQVGFNSEMDQALVYAGMMHGFLCGSGSYYFLVKQDGIWKVKDYKWLWVS